MLPRWSLPALFTLASITIAQRPPPVALCVPGPVFGTRCVVECGVNRHGQAHNSYKVSSFQACITECDIDWHCVTAQYERATHICHLKNTINPSRADRAVDGVTCGGGTLFPSATPSTTIWSTTTTNSVITTTTNVPPPSRGPFVLRWQGSPSDHDGYVAVGKDSTSFRPDALTLSIALGADSSLPRSAASVFRFDPVSKSITYTDAFGITLWTRDIFGRPQKMSLIDFPGFNNLTILEDWAGDSANGGTPGTLLITESTDFNDVFSPTRAWEACERYDQTRQQWTSLADIWFNGCDLIDEAVRNGTIGYLYVEYV